MAILGSSQRMSRGGFGLLGGRKSKAGQVVLRARSGRAYSFEVYPREAVADLDGLGAVYCYARAVPADASGATIDASGAGLAIGYVGKTDDMGGRDAQHQAQGHFTGHGFDIVLILRIAQAPIRADIEHDLRETFNPTLNDLLSGIEPSDIS